MTPDEKRLLKFLFEDKRANDIILINEIYNLFDNNSNIMARDLNARIQSLEAHGLIENANNIGWRLTHEGFIAIHGEGFRQVFN